MKCKRMRKCMAGLLLGTLVISAVQVQNNTVMAEEIHTEWESDGEGDNEVFTELPEEKRKEKENETQKNGTEESISEDMETEEDVPGDTETEEDIPENTETEESMPGETEKGMPEESMSEDAGTEEGMPGDTKMEEGMSEDTETEESIPGETEDSMPGESVPGETEESMSEDVETEESITENEVSDECVKEDLETEQQKNPMGEKEETECIVEIDSRFETEHNKEMDTSADRNEETVFTEIESQEDEETVSELLKLPEIQESSAVLYADAYTPPGILASAAGTGYTVVNVGDRRYSGNYCEIQRNKISEVIPWDNSGGNVIQGSRTNSGGKAYSYFVPKNKTAAGKFGFRVTNVAYSRTEKCAVDLLITVVAYNDYTYSAAGNKIEGVYPCIGYTPGGGIAYQPFLPAIRLKCDLVRSGTNTPVAGNYRFTMTDIDAGQIYGITLFDGKVDARYCTASTVIHTGIRTLSDGKDYYMMYAPDIACQEGNKKHAISYEVSNMSSFGIFIDSEKRSGTTGGYSGNTIREAYADIQDGVWDDSAGALMGWESWAFGPAQVSPVNKYVSSDGSSWGTASQISAVDDLFWYMLEVYVPEMSGYSYQQFYLQDILPAGADYVGDLSVIKTETGENAVGYFQIVSGEELLIAYNGASGFQGYTYQIRFKVKMDPFEITPVMSGTTAVYTVENQAILYYQTNVDAAPLSTVSNTVSTTAAKDRPDPIHPVKRICWNGNMLEEKEFTDKKEEIIFTVQQQIPAYEPCWYMDSFVFEDILEPCFELVRIALGTDRTPSSTVFEANENNTSKNNWNFRMENGKITAALGKDGISGAHFAGDTVYRMDLTVRVKEGYDLLKYYQTVSEQKEAAVIPNRASVTFGWGNDNVVFETNQVKVLISEVFGTVTLSKKNQSTNETVPDAGFTLYQWNQSEWEKLEEFSYDKNRKEYYVNTRLQKTDTNNGRFRIEEHHTPKGFSGNWNREFVLEGTPGVCTALSYEVFNTMATGRITVKKVSENGTLLKGAQYEIYVKTDIKSPGGQVLKRAGEKAASIITKEDGSATTGELYPGVYEVREVLPPEGYRINTVPKTVEIVYVNKEEGGSHETVTFQNQPTLVYLYKVSAPAEKEKEKTPLCDVSFAVWNKKTQKEQDAAVYSTDQEGKIALRGLLPGTYCFKEIVTLPGYVPDLTVREFTIDKNGRCMGQDAGVIEVENQFICADFLKKDKATGRAVAGAELRLVSEKGEEIDTWVSGEQPYRIERIPAGNYLLQEISAPEGYKKAKPVRIEIKEKSGIQTFSIHDIKYVTVHLEKRIRQAEIVWAHGNPVFTFCLEGTDLEGEKHTFYETVEFTSEQMYESEEDDGMLSLCAVFEVPAGTYTAYETNVIRYRLEKINGVTNGSVSGPAVLFDLRGNKDGTAVFYNRKITDTGISDTDFVRNVIIE